MHDRSQYRSDNCSVARTLSIVGERWTLLVLREAFYGVRRFDVLQHHLGIARNVLTARLQTLVDHQLLTREPYQELGSRERFEYRLTERGRDLFPALVALMQWGDRYLADHDGPPVVIQHRDCGAGVHIDLHCEAGHTALGALDTMPTPGPGAHLANTPEERRSPSPSRELERGHTYDVELEQLGGRAVLLDGKPVTAEPHGQALRFHLDLPEAAAHEVTIAPATTAPARPG
jgi:DNA-binding HxlR family transcriptional regulator